MPTKTKNHLETMAMNLIRRSPTAIIFSVMMTFVAGLAIATGSNNLAASGFGQGSARVASAQKPDPPLSKIQLQKINDFFVTNGQDGKIGAKEANRLELSKDELTLKELALKEDKSGDIHSYSLLPDGGMLLIFSSATRKYAYALHIDSKFKIIASSARINNIASNISDVEEAANAEFAWWRNVADQL